MAYKNLSDLLLFPPLAKIAVGDSSHDATIAEANGNIVLTPPQSLVFEMLILF